MLSATDRTQIKKAARKVVHDVEQLHRIIDESLIAHIAISD
ncbi:flavin-nucleotide-binding protein, partial [Vibrio vulnificus]